MSKRSSLLFSTLAFQVAIVGCSDKGQTDAERKGAELKKHCVEIECGVEEHLDLKPRPHKIPALLHGDFGILFSAG